MSTDARGVEASHVAAEAGGQRGDAAADVPGEGGRATTPALEVSGLRAAYGGIEVLHGFDLVVPPSGVVALLGTNGAGKTTFLRALSGHLTANLQVTAGTVRYRGTDVTGKSSHWLTRRGICLIPEGRGIFPNLTVAENMWMWTHSGRASRQTVQEEVFSRFPVLAERRGQLAGTLSGGQQQMLALSRAVASRPDVLLIDELSMGLAPLLVEELFREISAIAASGVFVLLVEQSVAFALEVADRVGIVARGRIERFGEPAEVAAEALELYLS